ncbi:MAG TPA: ECF transporter S component [Candidatus Sulfomarinibacteraceae bacterium]|nr:ECF transporter S component [Candidatus Sulfomarinibacteraceae bacterium]
MNRFFSGLIYALGLAIGVLAFAYPFLQSEIVQGTQVEATAEFPLSTPLLTMILLGVCLMALLVEMQGEAASAKVAAALGMMVAVASVLRFVETAIPGPGGFTPIFVPVILAGYVFGARFGFLMGVFTLLVSALITGGVGPWLPYQMFVAAWVGFSAGWLPHPAQPRAELTMLVLFAILWGFLYGFLTNLYFWPFLSIESQMSWEPGAGFLSGFQRYLAFYAATSFLWDVIRAAGNAALVLVLGLPTVRALLRFRNRFQFQLHTAGGEGRAG